MAVDMRRIFVDPESIDDNIITVTNPKDDHHLANVIRIQEGDKITVSDKSGYEYPTVVSRIDHRKDIDSRDVENPKNVIELTITEKRPFTTEPNIWITLFQGLPKQDKMDVIIQKSIELGASEIVPVKFTHAVPSYDEKKLKARLERWRRIAFETVKQCGRGVVPEIAGPITPGILADSVAIGRDASKKIIKKYDLLLMAYEAEEDVTIKDALRKWKIGRGAVESANDPAARQRIGVIVGPEGGISESEAAALAEAGVTCVSLGKSILRTETAGPAAIAMLLYELEL
jgi:16S rRNA (uracil1498-N3)-methyltransferase